MQDSVRLQRLLDGRGEIKLNTETLRELEQNSFLGTPEVSMDKPWMEFDETLPALPQEQPKKEKHFTLKPYTPTTPYNWDPVYQRKIKVNGDTWRGAPFYRMVQSAKAEARATAKKSSAVASGNLMAPFTREFWDFKGKKRLKRTLEVLRVYGDSTLIRLDKPRTFISK